MADQKIFPACANTIGKANAEMTMKHVINPATCDEGKNKPGRAIRCVPQAQIAVFGEFSIMLTDIRTDAHTDGRTYGRTHPLIEMRGRI